MNKLILDALKIDLEMFHLINDFSMSIRKDGLTAIFTTKIYDFKNINVQKIHNWCNDLCFQITNLSDNLDIVKLMYIEGNLTSYTNTFDSTIIEKCDINFKNGTETQLGEYNKVQVYTVTIVKDQDDIKTITIH